MYSNSSSTSFFCHQFNLAQVQLEYYGRRETLLSQIRESDSLVQTRNYLEENIMYSIEVICVIRAQVEKLLPLVRAFTLSREQPLASEQRTLLLHQTKNIKPTSIFCCLFSNTILLSMYCHHDY